MHPGKENKMIILILDSNNNIWRDLDRFNTNMFERILRSTYYPRPHIYKDVRTIRGILELVGTIDLDQYVQYVDSFVMNNHPKKPGKYFDMIVAKFQFDDYLRQLRNVGYATDIAYHMSMARENIGFKIFTDKNEIEYWCPKGTDNT